MVGPKYSLLGKIESKGAGFARRGDLPRILYPEIGLSKVQCKS